MCVAAGTPSPTAGTLAIVLGAYAGVYYLVCRSFLRDIRAVDPEFYVWLGGAIDQVSPRNSTAISKVLFDDLCPKPSYPLQTKRKIRAARLMLYLSPLWFLAIFATL